MLKNFPQYNLFTFNDVFPSKYSQESWNTKDKDILQTENNEHFLVYSHYQLVLSSVLGVFSSIFNFKIFRAKEHVTSLTAPFPN